ncbi:MAG: hypothetical protein CMQ20_14155 [Gammaproteobacteria bacterium]|jgi:hypothetical protein|nr:hypothetical protein [Gammaproteobacteria bacterium]|tara:strand:- start:63 stop:485 length:423 start_codon:yes stop_codon:yes gene_type:complete
MIPNTDSALRMLSQRLMTQLLPDLKSEYSQSDGMLLGMLMMAIADEVATGIDTRMKDIADMKALLEQGRDYHDAGLLTVAEPASLSLKDVNQLHDDLTRHLIELHARVEIADSSEASQMLGDIWHYLEASTGRHAIAAMG